MLKELGEIVKPYFGNLLDCIVFGSYVKGSINPKDIDVLLLFAIEKDSRVVKELREKFQKLDPKISVTAVTYEELLSENFLARQGVFWEGFSLRKGKKLIDAWGFKPFSIFRVRMAGLKKKEKVRFHYALYGRKGKGFLEEADGSRISPGVFIIPSEYSNSFEEFLQSWDIEYYRINVLVSDFQISFLKQLK